MKIKHILWAAVLVSLPSAVVLHQENWNSYKGDWSTKNAVSAVLWGVILNHSQAQYVNGVVEKNFWKDAPIHWNNNDGQITSRVELLTSTTKMDLDDVTWKWSVDKIWFDWSVQKIRAWVYEIGRFGPKFDGRIKIELQEGEISGTYERDGINLDWTLSWTYDHAGKLFSRRFCAFLIRFLITVGHFWS
jgi:hypothetical protein